MKNKIKTANAVKRILFISFTVMLCLCLIPLCKAGIKASAADHTVEEAMAWCESNIKQKVGSGQCVAFIKAYYAYLGVIDNSTGDAKDYATKKEKVPKGWERVEGGVPEPGDILVYTGAKYGHVAIYAGGTTSYHQNISGEYVEKITNWKYNKSWYSEREGGTKTYWGYIRPDFNSFEFNVEQCVGNGQTFATDEKITLSGWAFNSSGDETTVYYSIDGSQAVPFEKVNRDDVVNVYECEQRNCGFSKTISLINLKDGTHKLKIWCSDGKNQKDMTSVDFTVVEKPAKVKNLKASSKTDTTITLTWSKANKAEKYIVYKYNKSTKKYTRLGTTEKTTYTVKSLKPYTSYQFAVRSMRTVNKKNFYSNDYSSIYTVKTRLAAAKNLNATQTTGSITLTWSKVSQATEYNVYTYNANVKGYTWLLKVKTNKAIVKKLKSATIYRYFVQAVNKDDLGVNSAILKTATKPTKPGLTAKSNGCDAVLTWKKVTGASGYEIYMKKGKDGTFKKLDSTSASGYTAKNLNGGNTYYFKVRAYVKVDSKKIYSDFSSTKSVKIEKLPDLKNVKLSLTDKSNSLKLTWSKQSKATGYEIYRSTTGKSGSYKKIATLKNSVTGYTEVGLKTSTVYYYKIRSYKKVGSKNIYSNYKTLCGSTRLTKAAAERLLRTASEKFREWWHPTSKYKYGKDIIKVYNEKYNVYQEFNRVEYKGIDSKAQLKNHLRKYYTDKVIVDDIMRDEYIDYKGHLYICHEFGDEPLFADFENLKSVNAKSPTICTVTVNELDYLGTYSQNYNLKLIGGRWVFDSAVYVDF